MCGLRLRLRPARLLRRFFVFRDTSAVKSTHRALPQHAQALIHPFHITPNRPLSSKSTAAGAAAVSRIDRRDRTTQHSERGGVTTQHPNLNKPQAATSPEIEGRHKQEENAAARLHAALAAERRSRRRTGEQGPGGAASGAAAGRAGANDEVGGGLGRGTPAGRANQLMKNPIQFQFHHHTAAASGAASPRSRPWPRRRWA